MKRAKYILCSRTYSIEGDSAHIWKLKDDGLYYSWLQFYNGKLDKQASCIDGSNIKICKTRNITGKKLTQMDVDKILFLQAL